MSSEAPMLITAAVKALLEEVPALKPLTLVVGGAPAAAAVEVGPGELAARVARREAAGDDRKAAIAAVAQEAGLPKRRVFDAVAQAKVGRQ